ncbi:MAG: hypothetical protein AAFV19_24140 [Pseudomonadota bacterium]
MRVSFLTAISMFLMLTVHAAAGPMVSGQPNKPRAYVFDFAESPVISQLFFHEEIRKTVESSPYSFEYVPVVSTKTGLWKAALTWCANVGQKWNLIVDLVRVDGSIPADTEHTARPRMWLEALDRSILSGNDFRACLGDQTAIKAVREHVLKHEKYRAETIGVWTPDGRFHEGFSAALELQRSLN